MVKTLTHQLLSFLLMYCQNPPLLPTKSCFCAFKSLSKSTTLLPKLYHKAQGVALLGNLIFKIISYCSLLIKPHWQKAWSGRLRRAVGDEWLSVQIMTVFASAEVIDANVFGVFPPSRFCSYPIKTEFNQPSPNTLGVNTFHLTLTETPISLNINFGLCFRTVNGSDFCVKYEINFNTICSEIRNYDNRAKLGIKRWWRIFVKKMRHCSGSGQELLSTLSVIEVC